MTTFQTELFNINQMQSTARYHGSTIRSTLCLSVEGVHQGAVPGPLRIWRNHLHGVSRPIEIHHKESDWRDMGACLQKKPKMKANSEPQTEKEKTWEKKDIKKWTSSQAPHFLMECKWGLALGYGYKMLEGYIPPRKWGISIRGVAVLLIVRYARRAPSTDHQRALYESKTSSEIS